MLFYFTIGLITLPRMMVKVALHNVKFFAHHGYYADEQVMGTHFVVNAEVEFKATEAFTDDNLSQTINYEQLYTIMERQMRHTRKLIETVAQGIIDEVVLAFPQVERAVVGISKLNPPLPGNVGSSFVQLSYQK